MCNILKCAVKKAWHVSLGTRLTKGEMMHGILSVFYSAILFKNVDSVSDVATRHSGNSCQRMTESEGRPIVILMDLIHRCNRSLPHMEVVSSVCEILISLAEYPQTRDFISSEASIRKLVLKTSLEIMRIYREKNQLQIFSKLSSFLWKMSHNDSFLKVINLSLKI